MKVNRHNTSESYNITVGWLNDFSKSILKESNYLDNIKSILHNPDRRWMTIDEKMADIKSRVGFDKLNIPSDPNAEIEVIAGDCANEEESEGECSACSSGNACPCSEHPEDFSDEDLNKMNVILKYVLDMIRGEPHLDEHSVISKCRDEEGLGFNDLPVDIGALKNYIIDSKKIYSKKEDSPVEYELWEPSADDHREDRDADYFAHGIPAEL